MREGGPPTGHHHPPSGHGEPPRGAVAAGCVRSPQVAEKKDGGSVKWSGFGISALQEWVLAQVAAGDLSETSSPQVS